MTLIKGVMEKVSNMAIKCVSIKERNLFRKEKEVDLYSAYRQYNSTTKHSDVDHTELPANTPHLPLLCISIC